MVTSHAIHARSSARSTDVIKRENVLSIRSVSLGFPVLDPEQSSKKAVQVELRGFFLSYSELRKNTIPIAVKMPLAVHAARMGGRTPLFPRLMVRASTIQ